MKKIILLVLSFAFALIANAQPPPVIGTVDGDVYTITYDLNEMETKWENVLSGGGVTAELDNFRITFDSENSQYLLLADDDAQTLKAAIELEDSGEGNLVEKLVAGDSRTVTCTGCAVGCSPKKDAYSNWSCTPPCSSNTCTKTETVVVDGTIF